MAFLGCGDSGTARCGGAEAGNRWPSVRPSGRPVSFGGARFSGSPVVFVGAEFSGGQVDFAFPGAEFSGSPVSFSGVFSGSHVHFDGARFSGGQVDFDGAVFAGEVAFTGARDWSVLTAFPWTGAPPVGVKLPKKEDQSQA
jgi:Pentapeptide repeats (9 copies)